jgi:hypothetical protein
MVMPPALPDPAAGLARDPAGASSFWANAADEPESTASAEAQATKSRLLVLTAFSLSMKFRGLPDLEGVVERRNACLVTLSWSCRVPKDLAAGVMLGASCGRYRMLNVDPVDLAEAYPTSTLIARRFRPALTGKIYFFKWTENRARVFHALNRDVPFENYVETECCTSRRH